MSTDKSNRVDWMRKTLGEKDSGLLDFKVATSIPTLNINDIRDFEHLIYFDFDEKKTSSWKMK